MTPFVRVDGGKTAIDVREVVMVGWDADEGRLSLVLRGLPFRVDITAPEAEEDYRRVIDAMERYWRTNSNG